MEIRAAAEPDAAAVTGLVERAYAHYVPRIGFRPQPMQADYTRVVGEGGTFLAVGEDRIVGVIVLRAEDDHLLVWNVAVEPERQGFGIGATLLEFAEVRGREAGFGEIRLFTHELMRENIAIYSGLGWEETERREMGGFHLVWFVKSLG
jgi:ribosomal protein S18 acetylase RimI-like enzyme